MNQRQTTHFFFSQLLCLFFLCTKVPFMSVLFFYYSFVHLFLRMRSSIHHTGTAHRRLETLLRLICSSINCREETSKKYTTGFSVVLIKCAFRSLMKCCGKFSVKILIPIKIVFSFLFPSLMTTCI